MAESIDIEVVKKFCDFLTTDEHKGDVNNSLGWFVPQLGLGDPVWCDTFESFVMPWGFAAHWKGVEDDQDEDHSCDVPKERD